MSDIKDDEQAVQLIFSYYRTLQWLLCCQGLPLHLSPAHHHHTTQHTIQHHHAHNHHLLPRWITCYAQHMGYPHPMHLPYGYGYHRPAVYWPAVHHWSPLHRPAAPIPFRPLPQAAQTQPAQGQLAQNKQLQPTEALPTQAETTPTQPAPNATQPTQRQITHSHLQEVPPSQGQTNCTGASLRRI